MNEPQRPTSDDDRDGWKAYWTAQGMSWRTEPEIDVERQRYLAERFDRGVDIVHGVYPLRDIEPRLTRADVEWLLATGNSDYPIGQVDWPDEQKRHRKGLDIRGADLSGINLSNLPLAELLAGFVRVRDRFETRAMRMAAAINLEGANLGAAHLERANLARANLREADLNNAHLEQADLYGAHLEGISLYKAHIGGANLRNIYLNNESYLHRALVSSREYVGVLVADIRWGAVNLATVEWQPMRQLGDEQVARRRTKSGGPRKTSAARLRDYQAAVRANRQLAIVLKDQGLDEYGTG